MHRLFTALGAPFFAGALLLSLIAAPSPAVSAPVAKPANYDHPIRDPGTTNHFTVTVCDSSAPGWVWKNPYNIKGPGEVSVTNSGSGQHGGVRSNGTDGSVEIIGNSVGENTVEFDITQDSDGATVHVTLKIVVIACGSSTAAGGNGDASAPHRAAGGRRA